MAAALGHAITKVGSEGSVVQKVRMFSDCRIVLEGLDTGSISCLGPALSSGWAVQAIYDRTDLLEERGVSIQLVRLKGHAKSEGNGFADQAECEAVWSQIRLPPKRNFVWKKKEQCSRKIFDMGRNSADEWYWRVNKSLLLSGRVEDDEEVEEDDGSADMDCSE